jgi:hypothetical protein
MTLPEFNVCDVTKHLQTAVREKLGPSVAVKDWLPLLLCDVTKHLSGRARATEFM